MKNQQSKLYLFYTIFLTFAFYGMPVNTIAADDNAALKSRIEVLEKELAEMKALLEAQIQQSATKEEVQAVKEDVKEEVQAVKKDVEVAKSETQEWKTYDSDWHLAGYAAVGWTDDDSEDNDRFNLVQYNPVFHYQFKDLILFEGELEMEVEEDGGTEIALEYAAINWFVNDYMTLQAGKFLSPIGHFRQNLHPLWVNKLPTAPSGFGHDQAAPLAELGIQLRGGFQVPIAEYSSVNYAVYVGNGPELELNAAGDEIEAVGTEGYTRDLENEKVYGGRLGFLPFPNMEIGVSGAIGEVGLEVGGINEPTRDYEVFGADLFARWRKLDLRAEYVYQNVDAQISSIAPEGQDWSAWYTQLSYLFPYNFEGVVRFSDFESSHSDQEQEQWALGINYLFSANAMAKLAYEWNDGLEGAPTDDDALYLQLSYGF